MDKNAKIYVAGHSGLVGSAIVRNLKAKGYNNLILRGREELDLFDLEATRAFFDKEKPEYVIDAAARVGGIGDSMRHHADFLYENLEIQSHLIWSAKEAGVKKFLFLGSSCIYPKDCPQPMKEEHLLTGPQEPTNEGYSIAKIAGIKLCEFIYDQYGMKFVSVQPTNIYGPYDNFNLETSHVIPALIRRMHEAKLNKTPEVIVWGTGNTKREFLYTDDLADAIVWVLENYDQRQFLNIGTGEDVSIKDLAGIIKKLVGYEGELVFDASKPDGVPRKLLDVSKLNAAGWHHQISLEDGLERSYKWYLENIAGKANEEVK